MHGYAGNPANYPEEIELGDDGTDVPAFTTFNTPPEGLADRTAWLKANLTGAQVVANWNPWNGNPGAYGSGDTDELLCCCWDSYYGCWLFAGISPTRTNFPILYSTGDGGKSFQNIYFGSSGYPEGLIGGRAQFGLPASNTPLAMQVSADTGSFCVFQVVSGTGVAGINRQVAGGSFVFTAQPFLDNVTFPPAPAMYSTPRTAGSFGLFAIKQAGTTYTTLWAVSATDGTGLWTNQSASLPAAWQTGTSTIRAMLVALQTGNPGQGLVAMCGKVPGTDTSRLLNLFSETDITPSWSAGQSITGIAWNNATSLWGVTSWDGTNSYLYTSPDLVTWTLANTFTTSFVSALAVVGAAWVVLFRFTGDPVNRVAWSANVVQASTVSSWQSGDYSDPYPFSSATPALPQLVSSGEQLFLLEPGGGGPVATPGSSGGLVAVSQRVGALSSGLGVF